MNKTNDTGCRFPDSLPGRPGGAKIGVPFKAMALNKGRAVAWLAVWLLVLVLPACHSRKKKQLNRRVTLWRQDKIPYGTYFAYENLQSIFPNADITLNKKSPATFEGDEGKKAYIIIVPEMIPDASELRGLMNFVGRGNTVFISAFIFGDSLLRSLNSKGYYGNFFNEKDSLQLSVYDPVGHDSLSFVYPGKSYDGYADSLDLQYASILGRDASGRPDFVRFTYKGGGALYLHFAPMAFTNFFLLHKANKAYYDKVLSYLPVSVAEVKWDEYFRYSRVNFSAFRYILANPSLRWAFWLLLLLFLLIYVFESKRRQRLIPVIPGLRNSSLDFVRTIGRLYYQRRDNHNLALKMAAHFQDLVRTRYNLPASTPDNEWVDRLSYKTDLSREWLQGIVTTIQSLQERSVLSDEELLEFSGMMKEFYKQV
jgi:hypothetical protein